MKRNFKRLTALLMALLLALVATGVAESAGEETGLFEDISDYYEVLAPEMEEQPEEIGAFDLMAPEDAGQEEQVATPDAVTPPEPVYAQESAAEEEVASGELAPKAATAKATIGVGEKYQIDASKLTGKLTYKSSDKKIATVTSKGVVTGKKAGKTKITVTPKKGGKLTVTVTVQTAPAKVTLNKTSETLIVGETLKLKAKLPSKTASNKLTWTSSKKSVAKVDAKGKVTAVGEGTATITVKTFNGKKATCKVTVEEDDEDDEDDEDEDDEDNTSYELREYLGGTLEALNNAIPDKLIWDGSYYSNDYFSVTVNEDGQISRIAINHSIIPANGGAKYQLWGIFPYMGISDANRRLGWGLWKPVANSGNSFLFYSNSFPNYSIFLTVNSLYQVGYLSYSIK